MMPQEQNPNMRQLSREATLKGSCWRCVTLPLIDHRVGDGADIPESSPQSQVTETQPRYLTD